MRSMAINVSTDPKKNLGTKAKMEMGSAKMTSSKQTTMMPTILDSIYTNNVVSRWG